MTPPPPYRGDQPFQSSGAAYFEGLLDGIRICQWIFVGLWGPPGRVVFSEAMKVWQHVRSAA